MKTYVIDKFLLNSYVVKKNMKTNSELHLFHYYFDGN